MRIPYLLLMLAALGVIATPGYARWKPVAHPTPRALHAIQVLSDGSGWAVGENGTLVGTLDGGATWAAQPVPLTNDLLCVSFASPMVGWVSGAGDGVAKTADGGASWQRITVVADDLGLGPPDTIAPVVATDETHAWALVRWGDATFLYRTQDGGDTWQSVRYTDHGYNAPGTVYGMDFSSDAEGWLVAGRIGGPPEAYMPVFLRTLDAGSHWQAFDAYATDLNQPASPDWRAICSTLSPDDILAHVEDPARGVGVLFHLAKDPQDLWRQAPMPLDAPLQSVSRPDPATAYLVGTATWQSNDYAHTFRRIPNDAGAVLSASFPDAANGWAAATDGTILRWIPDPLGDVNGDGTVSLPDAVLAAAIATGTDASDSLAFQAADIAPAPNGDGAVTMADVTALLRLASGIE